MLVSFDLSTKRPPRPHQSSFSDSTQWAQVWTTGILQTNNEKTRGIRQHRHVHIILCISDKDRRLCFSRILVSVEHSVFYAKIWATIIETVRPW